MKAPYIPAMPPEVNLTPLRGNIVSQNRKILATEIAPSRLLKIVGEKEHPNKLMKKKGRTRNDVKNEGTSQ